MTATEWLRMDNNQRGLWLRGIKLTGQVKKTIATINAALLALDDLYLEALVTEDEAALKSVEMNMDVMRQILAYINKYRGQ